MSKRTCQMMNTENIAVLVPHIRQPTMYNQFVSKYMPIAKEQNPDNKAHENMRVVAQWWSDHKAGIQLPF